MAKVLEIPKKQAIDLLVALGFKTAKSKSTDRLTEMLNAVEQAPDDPLPSEELDDLLDELLSHEEAVCIDGEPEEPEEPEESEEPEEPEEPEDGDEEPEDGDEEPEESEDGEPKKAKKGGKAKAKGKDKKAKAKDNKATAKTKGPKKPGVIATIIEMCQKKARTKEQIVAELVKKFPDRPEEGMKSTVTIQLGGRLAKDKGLKVSKDSKGRYSIK